MSRVVTDDHLLRDVLSGERSPDLGGIATSLATTGLWLFRLCSAWAAPEVVGKLTAPVAALPPHQQELSLVRLVALPDEIEVLPLRQLAWPMSLLERRHRGEGRPLSAAMVERSPPPRPSTQLSPCPAMTLVPISRRPPSTIRSHSTSCS